ncbi:hypothetical protein [Marinovum sp.]|uniref:hypothetical protein n=1 Tax=Marinovum sp. TaxID=2024839 RepID=UPI002B2719B2|nr:hypothetical protein [Marinovum sp.]
MSDLTPTRAALLMDQLARLLRDEIAAIGQGQLARVEELYPRKAELLGEIEAGFGQPEKFLPGSDPAAVSLRAKLEELRGLIQTDLQLLQRMTEATGAVAKEIDRIRDRQSLRGLYDREGATKTPDVSQPQRLDQSI